MLGCGGIKAALGRKPCGFPFGQRTLVGMTGSQPCGQSVPECLPVGALRFGTLAGRGAGGVEPLVVIKSQFHCAGLYRRMVKTR